MAREITFVLEDGVDPHDALVRAVQALSREIGIDAEIEKAHPPHVSQFLPRTKQGQFRPARRYRQGESGLELNPAHPSQHQPRDLRGRFLRRLDDEEQAAAREQADEWVRQLDPRLQRHLSDYERGAITSKEWASRCADDIRLFYDLCYKEGKRAAGDPAVRITATDRGIVNRLVKDELTYLHKFADDMDAGKGRMEYHERMHLYSQAAREAFWNGWITGDLRPQRQVRWTFGPTEEHCTDCSRFVAMGWTPVPEFYWKVLAKGYAPQSGQLECQGHRCLCSLQERVTRGGTA